MLPLKYFIGKFGRSGKYPNRSIEKHYLIISYIKTNNFCVEIISFRLATAETSLTNLEGVVSSLETQQADDTKKTR